MTIREAIEVGAFTSTRIQRLWDADPAVHWQRCAARGLECPQEVFTQLFHEDANNEDSAAIVRAVDWAGSFGNWRSSPAWRCGKFGWIVDFNMRWMRRAIGPCSPASPMTGMTL